MSVSPKMFRVARLLLLAAVLVTIMVREGRAESMPVTLAKDGAPQLPIATGSVKEPVAELGHYLQRMTGGHFDIRPAAPNRAGIHVGLVADFPWLEIDRPEDLGPEGFVLRSDGRSVYLVGAGPLGVRHAVTTFLHHLGCRWFFPGEAWEIIPKRETVTGEWNERQVPAFPTQRRIWYGFGASESGRRDLADWERHNRMGGPLEVAIGHTWHGLKPEGDFAEHPDWFALVDGKRQPTKPCYSHPEVLRCAKEAALARAEEGTRMITMTPPDGLGYCECERCLAVFEGSEPVRDHQSLFARRPDGVLVNITSETLFRFVNSVAAAVAEKHPETLVGCYAYSAYSHPPSFPLHPNVYLQTTSAFRRTPITLKEQIGAFGRKTQQVGIREYYSVYQWDWDYPGPGKVTPATLAEDLRFYHRNGVTAVNAEASNNWAVRGLGYYVASQLMWDLDSDLRELLRDFYRQAFGPAAGAMQRYYARWDGPGVAALEDEPDVPELCVLYEAGKFDPEALRAAYRDLDTAVGLVPADSDYRRRIDLIRMYAHYLFLRYRLHEAERTGERDRILDAIKEETIFGGRLTDTHMIHSRPLIGKAFLRRFKKHESLLEDLGEAQQAGRGWRQTGEPPTRPELEKLWMAGKAELGMGGE